MGNNHMWDNYIKQERECLVCGKKFTRPPSVFKKGKGKYCSQSCANGKPRSNEKTIKQSGYVHIKTYEHPLRNKQNLVAEHRVVAEGAIGRYLKNGEVVHHINGNKGDNRKRNLVVCSHSYHVWLHHKMFRRHIGGHFGNSTTTEIPITHVKGSDGHKERLKEINKILNDPDAKKKQKENWAEMEKMGKG